MVLRLGSDFPVLILERRIGWTNGLRYLGWIAYVSLELKEKRKEITCGLPCISCVDVTPPDSLPLC